MWSLLQLKRAFDEFYENCTDDSLRDKIYQRAAYLMEHGNAAKYPITDSLGGGLHELRADAGRLHARFLFCYLPQKRVVIVIAVYKDQRVLPDKIIREARQLIKLVEDGEEIPNAVNYLN